MIARVYTRHSKSCPRFTSRYWTRCSCPKWVWVTDQDGSRALSAHTRSWAKAEECARILLKIYPDDLPAERTTIAHAVDSFLQDKRLQNLAPATITKLEGIFDRQFSEWFCGQSLVYLDEIRLRHLESFRASWKDEALARKKKQERIGSFFHYCVRHKWLSDNPAQGLSRVKVSQRPTDYFTKDEFARLIDAIPLMYQDPRGSNGNAQGLRDRLEAMVLLLRWSGLRIGDAVGLERVRLTDDGKLNLRMAKTGEHVFVPLPDEVAECLRTLPNSNPKYFFWTGNGALKSAVADWQRTFRRLFAKAEMKKRCHPHMFRDTFAVQYLLAGVPLDQVSVLLGHRDVRITLKHYSPWVKARQEQLERIVRAAW